MQLKQILKVTLSLIHLRTFGDIAITTDLAYVSTVTYMTTDLGHVRARFRGEKPLN